MPVSRRGGIVLVSLLLAGVSAGGVLWLLSTRPVTSARSETWICSLCAAERTETVRSILEVAGSTKTNRYRAPISRTLDPDEECSHEWLLLHDVKDAVRLSPLPQGHSSMHIRIDLRGITDREEFNEALALVAAKDRATARKAWSRLVATPATSAEIQTLKQMLGEKKPAAEVAGYLESLAGKPALKGDRSSP